MFKYVPFIPFDMSVHPPLSEEHLNLLYEEAKNTIFCTLNKDGTIHATPIWFRYREDGFYSLTFKKARKLVNLKRNNTVSLSIVTIGEGEDRGKVALVYGKAEIGVIPDDGLEAVSSWILGKYMPKDKIEGTLSQFNQLDVILVRVVPEKIVHYYP